MVIWQIATFLCSVKKNMEIVYPATTIAPSDANHFVYTLPERIGSGVMQSDSFASGLRLVYSNMQFERPTTFVLESTSWQFGICYSLAGSTELRLSTYHRPISVLPGQNCHHALPETTVTEEEVESARRIKVCVLFGSKVLLDFAGEDEEAFLPFLQGVRDQACVHGNNNILPQMHQTLNQLINCSYTGKARLLFLEGKALELLAHKLDQIRLETRSTPRQYRITPDDVERIHHAAWLLRQDPINPPDITTLSTRVEMGRSRFYECFKEVYNHSPAEHLRSYRLQLAKRLLRQGNHNVTEAALAVGYSNLSHFAKVFTSEFGVTPHKLS